MATNYRTSRNIEASIIDYIKEELASAGWPNIAIEKTFARVKANITTIVVRVGNTDHSRAEVGGTSTFREPLVLIDIFATDDGLRLDLKDFLISVLKGGIPFYTYVINNGAVQNKTANGRLNVINIGDTIVNLGVDKDNLDKIDRYRHLLTLTINSSKLEV